MAMMTAGYFEVIQGRVAQGYHEPRKGSVYTTRQIFDELALADSPCLQILWNKRRHPVQLSHMSDNMLNEWFLIAGDRKWRYVLTTSEWIPVFLYVDDKPPIDIVDAERMLDPLDEQDAHRLWVTPVGFKRFQQ